MRERVLCTVKSLILLSIFTAMTLLFLVYASGYHGQRSFLFSHTNDTSLEEVVSYARSLTGTPYDPFMGGYENIGARLGFIVCSDVPNIAYGLSGISFEELLMHDFIKHPQAYDTTNGNNPQSSYFHRRARNLYVYFKKNGLTLAPSEQPAIGDLVFYSKRKRGFISHVALVTEVFKGGYRIMESAARRHLAREVDGVDPIKAGMKVIGFGRIDHQKI